MALNVVKKAHILIDEEILARLSRFRIGWESPEDTLRRVLVNFDEMGDDFAALAHKTSNTPATFNPKTGLPVAPQDTPKVAPQADIVEAITQALKAEGGEAHLRVVMQAVAKALPEFAAHPGFAGHISWAATAMKKNGRLLNGRDHNRWGFWKLVA